MDFLTEEELELLEPAPDIHALFVHYNELYFESRLGACSVEWSSARMTSCGGTCELVAGGAGGARIKLSQPLLKLRPTRDLKDVLLHEMTHAYMMLQGIRDNDRGGHGTIFKGIIQRINTSQLPDHQRPPGGYNVAVYHTMYAEVDHYRQHHWQCERCGNVVKRAMNRPPQEADCRGRMGRGTDCRDPDCRFHMHQKHCGGAWVKIKEPEGYQQKGKKRGGSSVSNASSSSGAAGGRTGSWPDGAPLPARRPKKDLGGGLPASAAAGTRPITDFFGGDRGSGQQRTGSAAAAAAGQAGQPGADVLPALQAVWGAAPAVPPVAEQQQAQQAQQAQQQTQQGQQAQQAQQQTQQGQQAQQQVQQARQPAERPGPSAEERRRLQAEAALRRLAGPAGRGGQAAPSMQHPREQQQQRPRQPQQPQHAGQRQGALQEGEEVIDLVGSPPGAPPGKPRWAGAAQRQQAGEQRLVGAGHVQHDGNGRAADGTGSDGSPGKSSCLECPVCGRQWGGAAISNAELNAHIDQCLNASIL